MAAVTDGIGGGEGSVLGKPIRFCAFAQNRVIMMGSSAYLRALTLADGGGGLGRRRCSSPRWSNSHSTSSPASRPMAAAKASGKLT